MRIAVIGGGLAGCATACELALAGHEVSLMERSGSVAAEASFAPTGAIAAAMLAGFGPLALAAAGQPPARATPTDLLRPGRARWAHQSRKPHPGTARHAQVLAQESPLRLTALAHHHQLALEDSHQAASLLVLFTTARARSRVQKLATRQHSGPDSPWQVPEPLDADAAQALEPGLATAALKGGAWHLPGQALIHAHTLAHALKDETRRLGAHIHFGQAVHRIEPGPPWRVEGQAYDAVVLCTGGLTLSGAGLPKPPLRPRWAMSLTAPLQSMDHNLEQGPLAGPQGIVADAQAGVVITRLGDRLRAATDCGWQAGDAATARRLYECLERWFPGAARSARVQSWSHAVALTPDGLPLVGPAGDAPGLWLHLGLGLHGAAWAVAGAHRLARQIGGAAPDALDAALAPSRWR
ncbi:MAG: FAD-binding oxidoreductase [Proteobacteria bacterium]|nr:FAD-binding oxidoreductase [Pseudomonadota bacterium]